MKKRKTPVLPFILASGSPRRRRLIAQLGRPVTIIPSKINEPSPGKKASPQRYVKDMARLKARDVARCVEKGLVLGADTVVSLKGKILGKPSSQKSAEKMLAALSGHWHEVCTGMVLIAMPGKKESTAVCKTRVKMRKFSKAEILYWSQRNHDKAGCYAAQQKGNPFIDTWQGDFDNIVGLPMKCVKHLIRKSK